MEKLFHLISRAAQASIKLAAGVACLFANIFFTRAQDLNYKIYYPYNDPALHADYLSNGDTLHELDSLLSVLALTPKDTVSIVSYSSPEGRYSYNLKLSQKRAASLRNYVVKRHPALAGRIAITSEAESWDDLRAAVEAVEEKEEEKGFLAGIRSFFSNIFTGDKDPDEREKELKAQSGYDKLYENQFPKLRYATFRIRFEKKIPVLPDEDVIIDENIDLPVQLSDNDTLALEPVRIDTVALVPIVVEPEYIRNTILALKTNMLYDAVTALNFEIEVPIADRWSVMVEDVFPWWETGNKYCFQMWEMGIEGRFWFKRWAPVGAEKLRGFFAGVYGMSSKYDFQYDRSINYQGEYWSTGLSGGYCMPIGKKKRLNLEFSLAVGYLYSDYRHYMPTDEYDRLIRDKYKVGKITYFGPTKAKVSLVWPITFKSRVK